MTAFIHCLRIPKKLNIPGWTIWLKTEYSFLVYVKWFVRNLVKLVTIKRDNLVVIANFRNEYEHLS
jgi:hypothetical protein